ncbi:transmembrane protein 179-like [Gadus macrocephalus]|uniref:transmembrane protein 179-like n=1 Tax=Gadus macrocephalus TaxID=80720 RepID=UPI0028CB633D|nr:transmembrane protein 179-like [Gadus macrocephalus]
MALDNFLFGQCILYFLAFLFGFISVVPLSENSDDFQGRCLLFTEGRWRKENATGGGGGGGGKERFVVEEWAPESSCRFVTFVGIASLIVSAVQAWRTFYYLCKGHDDNRVRVLLSLLASSALLCLLFVAGTLSTLGFSSWCTALRAHRPLSCEELQQTDLELGLDNSSFYDQFAIAQVGLWCSWLSWLVLVLLELLRVSWGPRRGEKLGLLLVQEKEPLLSL